MTRVVSVDFTTMLTSSRASLTETPKRRAYLVIRPEVRSPALRNRRRGPRRQGGGGREAGQCREEAEDFEMRDVRRDGLIEALLIAFTPPRGLPYPRVYPRC